MAEPIAAMEAAVQRLKWGDRRVLAIFCVTMVIAVFLGWRSQVNANTQHTAQVNACRVSNQNADAIGRLIDSLIEAVGNTASLPAAEKARRIATYQDSRPVHETCPR